MLKLMPKTISFNARQVFSTRSHFSSMQIWSEPPKSFLPALLTWTVQQWQERHESSDLSCWYSHGQSSSGRNVTEAVICHVDTHTDSPAGAGMSRKQWSVMLILTRTVQQWQERHRRRFWRRWIHVVVASSVLTNGTTSRHLTSRGHLRASTCPWASLALPLVERNTLVPPPEDLALINPRATHWGRSITATLGGGANISLPPISETTGLILKILTALVAMPNLSIET